MKKLTSLGLTALAALVAVLAVLGLQPSAQAYPEVQTNLTVDRQVLYGGEAFTVTATSENASCTWSLEWDGQVRESGETFGFVTTYTAPEVSEVMKLPLNGTCYHAAPGSRGAATWERSIMITVRPPTTAVSPPGASDLPNAGGPNLLFLAGGVALLIAGASAVIVARRRAEEAELQASRA